jgi:hypothetical protein
MSIEVQTVLAVSAPHLTSPWVPRTKVVDGLVYCRLHKWDRGLIKFAKNVALDFRKNSCREFNISLMDDLCKLRNIACDKALRDLRLQSDDGGADNIKKQKKYIRKARQSDQEILPNSVDITLPTIVLQDGGVIEGFSVRVLSDGIRTSELYMEMNSEVMNYIWEVVQKSHTTGRHWRKPAKTSRTVSRSRSPSTLAQESSLEG